MALSSQTSRSGVNRRYMVSRRRRSRRWPWVAALVMLLGVTSYFMFFRGGGTSDANAASNQPADRSGEVADNSPPPTAPAAPVTPGLTFDGRASRSAPVPGSQVALPPETSSSPAASTAPRTQTTPPPQPQPQPQASASAPAAATTTPPQTATRPSNAELQRGIELITDGKLVEGRQVLSRLLFDPQSRLLPADARMIRDALTSVNRELIFSPNVHAGDTVAEYYTVQTGDRLIRIAPQYKITDQWIGQINGIDPNRIRVGQRLKLIKGPLHARVVKSEYRMDLFLRSPDGSPIYVQSFRVGLGEGDSTPVGKWIIAPNSKTENPSWRNPRTGEFFAANDQKNPIGKFWLALKGTEPRTESLNGYGIHGTIEPDSIGRQASMGCVRLGDNDIKMVFAMLVEEHSTVEIIE